MVCSKKEAARFGGQKWYNMRGGSRTGQTLSHPLCRARFECGSGLGFVGIGLNCRLSSDATASYALAVELEALREGVWVGNDSLLL
jgi:hypothetical protein